MYVLSNFILFSDGGMHCLYQCVGCGLARGVRDGDGIGLVMFCCGNVLVAELGVWVGAWGGGVWLGMHYLHQCVRGCGSVGGVRDGGWGLVGNALFAPVCSWLWFGWMGKGRGVGFGWDCALFAPVCS